MVQAEEARPAGAGWYPDPERPWCLRYWGGDRWGEWWARTRHADGVTEWRSQAPGAPLSPAAVVVLVLSVVATALCVVGLNRKFLNAQPGANLPRLLSHPVVAWVGLALASVVASTSAVVISRIQARRIRGSRLALAAILLSFAA